MEENIPLNNGDTSVINDYYFSMDKHLLKRELHFSSTNHCNEVLEVKKKINKHIFDILLICFIIIQWELHLHFFKNVFIASWIEFWFQNSSKWNSEIGNKYSIDQEL